MLRPLMIMLAFASAMAVACAAAAPPAASPKLERYGLVLLRRGVRPKISKQEADSLQAGHMANIRRMFEGGALDAAGPFDDNTPLRGIFVFKADSLAELPRLLAPDPLLASRRLVSETHVMLAPAGIGAAYRERGTLDPGGKDSMVTFTMVLLNRGPKWTANVTRGLPELLARQQRELDRQRAAGALVMACPIEGLGELRGVYLYDADSTRTAALVAKDPAVKAGRLVPELHPWWTAAGVVPGH